MTMPRRKDKFEGEELKTADLAKSQGTAEDSEIEPERMKRVRSERSATGSDRPGPQTAVENTPLFAPNDHQQLQSRWNDIQTAFVDEPRTAVQSADSLVASTMQQLAEAFSRERSKLEQQWDRGDSISTEDLRVAFQKYRSFFNRLLAI